MELAWEVQVNLGPETQPGFTRREIKKSRPNTYVLNLAHADWIFERVNARQTDPSRTKEMYHVSFQGLTEVSRQMGMEMSRQRAHFNLARTADPVITLACLHANTCIREDTHT